MSSTVVASLNYASAQIILYGGLPIIVAGLLGGILNIIVFFSLRIFRESSCAIYLTAMSLVNIGLLLSGHLIRILISGFLIEYVQQSIVGCAIRIYISQICTLSSMSCICLATIDQFFATSTRPRLQQLCRPKIAYGLIAIVILFWILICSPSLVYNNIVTSPITNVTSCTVSNIIFQNYYYRFFVPILPYVVPFLIMVVFGSLAYRNVKQLSYRTVPLVRRQHEVQLTTMVLIQSLISLVILSPYFIQFAITYNINLTNDPVVLAQIQVFSSVTICLYYVFFAMPFYIYLCTSERFRQQLYYVLFNMHWYRWQTWKNGNNRVQPQVEQAVTRL